MQGAAEGLELGCVQMHGNVSGTAIRRRGNAGGTSGSCVRLHANGGDSSGSAIRRHANVGGTAGCGIRLHEAAWICRGHLRLWHQAA